MSEPTALDILIAARAKIAKPEDWGKGCRARRPFRTCCAAEAIEETSSTFSERVRTYRALVNAAGINRGSIGTWNDAPERSHADVIRAFDLAIATLSLGEPIRKSVTPLPCKETA